MKTKLYSVELKLISGTRHPLISGLSLKEAIDFIKRHTLCIGEVLQIEKTGKVLNLSELRDDHVTILWQSNKQFKNTGMFGIYYLRTEGVHDYEQSPERDAQELSLPSLREDGKGGTNLWDSIY